MTEEKWFIRETWYDTWGNALASTKLPGTYDNSQDACDMTARLNRLTQEVREIGDYPETTVSYSPSINGSPYEESFNNIPSGPTGMDWRAYQDSFYRYIPTVINGIRETVDGPKASDFNRYVLTPPDGWHSDDV